MGSSCNDVIIKSTIYEWPQASKYIKVQLDFTWPHKWLMHPSRIVYCAETAINVLLFCASEGTTYYMFRFPGLDFASGFGQRSLNSQSFKHGEGGVWGGVNFNSLRSGWLSIMYHLFFMLHCYIYKHFLLHHHPSSTFHHHPLHHHPSITHHSSSAVQHPPFRSPPSPAPPPIPIPIYVAICSHMDHRS